jgi:hypothetical protein
VKELEVPLLGGNVADGVVRVGRTVRKPVTPATTAVEAVLRHLEQVGFDGAPRVLGRDEQGRQVLEYVEGPLAQELPPMTVADLDRVGQLVRDLHDALASLPQLPKGSVVNNVCVTGYTCVVRRVGRVGCADLHLRHAAAGFR